MAEVVCEPNEIYLGTTRFPIRGGVRPYLVSVFPGKVVIGDYSKDDEQLASNWIIADQRGGILCEEMDEATQSDRCWWSNCTIWYKGHILLPRYADDFAASLTPEQPMSFATFNGKLYIGNNTTLYKLNLSSDLNLTTVDTVSGVITDLVAFKDYLYIFQDGDALDKMTTGETVSAVTGTGIANDAYGVVWNSALWGITSAGAIHYVTTPEEGGTWTAAGNLYKEQVGTLHGLLVGRDRNQAPIIFVQCTTGLWQYDYDSTTPANSTFEPTEVTLPEHPNAAKGCTRWRDGLFVSAGLDVLKYVAGSTAVVTSVGLNKDDGLPAKYRGEIVDLIPGHNFYYALVQSATCPGIVGAVADDGGTQTDETSAAQTSTTSNDMTLLPATPAVNDAYYFGADIEPDQLNVDIGTAGVGTWTITWEYYNGSWTALSDVVDGTTGFTAAAGARTVSWTQPADWVETSLQGAKAYWVRARVSAYTSITTQPKGDYAWFYTDEARYSSVMASNGQAWYPIWTADLENTDHKGYRMSRGIVSSAAGEYRLFFTQVHEIFYYALERDLHNPHQVATTRYMSSGVHITPWFDAGTAYDKLAVRLKIECDNITTTETVTVKYRTDHANTDIDTGWTTLATLNSTAESGETEHTFASLAGLVFRSIQFRFDLARGSTTTLSPDILKVSLSYLKLLKVLWGWSTVIDCSEEYKGNTPAQLDAALKALVETQTLATFTFKDRDISDWVASTAYTTSDWVVPTTDNGYCYECTTAGTSHSTEPIWPTTPGDTVTDNTAVWTCRTGFTHKVRIARIQGLEQTGEDWRNKYSVEIVAP